MCARNDLLRSEVRKLFNEEIEERLGPSAKPEEGFNDDIESVNLELYKDEEQQESFAPD
jgi:hypothetical protein